MIDGPASYLLRRHISNCADDYARAGVDSSGGNLSLRLVAVRLGQLGHAEVEDLDAFIFGDEKVLGFQITMDYALFVRGGEAVCDLLRILNRLTLGNTAAIQALPQGFALKQFRNDVG